MSKYWRADTVPAWLLVDFHRVGCCLAIGALLQAVLMNPAGCGEFGECGTVSEGVGASGPYCGVQSLLLLLKLAGKPVSLEDLLKPEYVASYRGSAVSDLVGAAQDHGLHAVVVANLTTRALKESPYPLILHVKGDVFASRYNHYVVFLGMRGDRAWLFDSSKGLCVESFADLVWRWNGVGIVVSNKPIAKGDVLAAEWANFARVGVAGLIVCTVAFAFCRAKGTSRFRLTRRRYIGLSIAEFGATICIAVAAGMLTHLLGDEGFLASPGIVRKATMFNFQHFLPEIGVAEVRRCLSKGEAVFVDARKPSDFQSGHLEGAINVPVNVSKAERAAALEGVAGERRIILYCQSAGCPYARVVAMNLFSDGFAKLALFPGGWEEWQKNEQDM